MNHSPAVHPTDVTLTAFGLGKLDDTATEAISNHLEGCPECRERVAGTPADSFLDRLRESRGRESTPTPGKSLSGVARSITPPSREKPNQSPARGTMPRELADHPDYEILRELGRGGMGVVYLARNRLMDRQEVLKVMNKEAISRPGAADRFLQEIRLAAQLNHPNVVRAYSALRLGDNLMFAMEYVAGDDLAALVKARGTLPIANACYYAQQVALGLQHAHEHKLVHRDIKPANLMLARTGKKHTVKILDFGLAKATSEDQVDGGLTGYGKMMGTPDYMAPEQALDAATAGIRADIYSLGCTLYFLLAGHPPFSAANLLLLLQSHQSVEARALNLLRPEVPPELAGVVSRMMAKDPARRFQTPGEVANALAPFVSPGATAKPALDVSRGTAESIPPTGTVPNGSVTPSPTPLAKPQSVATDSVLRPDRETLGEVSALPTTAEQISVPQNRRRRWVWPVTAVGAILVAVLTAWVGGVFKVKTPNGMIVVENVPSDAEVMVDGETVTITRDGEKVTLTALKDGKYRLKVVQGGKELRLNEADVIVAGETMTVRVEPSNTTAPPNTNTDVAGGGPRNAVAKQERTSFQPLSDSQDWKKWYKLRFPQSGTWDFSEGELRLGFTPKYIADNPVFATRRDDFRDFVIHFEVKVDGTPALFCFRDQPTINTGNKAYPITKGRGYAVLLADRTVRRAEWANQSSGSLSIVGGWDVPFGKVVTLAKATRDCWKKGEWNKVIVEAKGSSFAVSVNDERVVEYTDIDVLSRRGQFSFTPVGACTLSVRNVEVRELPPVAVPQISSPSLLPAEKGFVSLFNGKDLAGWKTAQGGNGPWIVEGGLLTATGQQSYLYSERADYKNFHLRAEIRLNQGGNSGLFFRATLRNDVPDGLQAELVRQQLSKNDRSQRIGAILSTNLKTLTESSGVEDNDGWFIQEIIAIDGKIEVRVNGELVAEHTLNVGFVKQGRIAIEHYSSHTVVEFRKIEIRELP